MQQTKHLLWEIKSVNKSSDFSSVEVEKEEDGKDYGHKYGRDQEFQSHLRNNIHGCRVYPTKNESNFSFTKKLI